MTALPSPKTPSRAALAVLLTGTFMASLDTAIVNVAGPAIQADVGVSGAALQLVISGYALAYAALLITGARLGDDHGHRRLFLVGLAGFTLTSLLAGLAWSTEVLIAARIGQGVAAAAMGPQVMTVIQLQYDGAARMKAMALLATSCRRAWSPGQVLGGALVDLDVLGASWRPVFLINVPVGLALLAIGARLLPVTRAAQRPPDGLARRRADDRHHRFGHGPARLRPRGRLGVVDVGLAGRRGADGGPARPAPAPPAAHRRRAGRRRPAARGAALRPGHGLDDRGDDRLRRVPVHA